MQVKLQKIGNSHMVTIPAEIVKSTALKVGDILSINKTKNSISLEIPKKKKVKLHEFKPIFRLDKKMTKKDFQEELKAIKEYRYE